MINSKKLQLVIAVILVCTRIAVLGVEPNEAGAALKLGAGEEPNQPKTELKFEISTKERQLGSKGLRSFTGDVKPKYVAIFSMSDLSRIYGGVTFRVRDAETVKMILSTSVGQSMSEIQKEFLKADKVISILSTRRNTKRLNMVNYKVEETEFGLYAFTLEDAKLVTEAFVETMTKKAREELPPLLEEFMNQRKPVLQNFRARTVDTKKQLSEKEPEAKSAESKYKTVKNTDRYKTLADSEAYEKAKETIAQMNKMLTILDIELAGILEKLAMIEKYRKSDKFSKATLEKLEQMFVEQMIELRGAEARKGAALRLRDRDKQFCDLYHEWTDLANVVRVLKNNLRSYEKKVHFYEESVANPPEELLPPKVLQNRVTIYPVRTQ